jgi:hypothetical protein
MASSVGGLSSTQDRVAAFVLSGRPSVMMTGFANRVVCLPPARHMALIFRWALCSAQRNETCIQKGIDMRLQLEQRVAELKSEYETGQKMLADLEAKKADLQTTLLRIGGAIQVLEELLAQEPEEEKAE